MPFSLIVPEEMDGREGTVRDFAARCSGIIMEAIKWAPETTRSLLQVRTMETEKKKKIARASFFSPPEHHPRRLPLEFNFVFMW